ncbi:hypothetical protein EJ05DRAFT_334641 [Pseudovirgaria hyperparasitica]|uniref:BRCT domain-containing protein n=1 Tax=Pseudovirgaria hyperparasitica TaxID=470096 RepID=A0A6A6WC51_9PEZI|nr:uncharacterized protein EJ05DRAFT_334641 [Pseudovirgaria hyperparasitica]KAF2759147.1 hypothetical protein EJ05DRAFT_334641 [Pseudovirgaria hyperparasitica]
MISPRFVIENLSTKNVTVLAAHLNSRYEIIGHSDDVLSVRLEEDRDRNIEDRDGLLGILDFCPNFVLCHARTTLMLKPAPTAGHPNEYSAIVDPQKGGPAAVALRDGDTFYFSEKEFAMQLRIMPEHSVEEIQVTSSPHGEQDSARHTSGNVRANSSRAQALDGSSRVTPHASFIKIDTVAETPTMIEGRHRHASKSPFLNGANDERPPATISTEASDVGKATRIPFNQRVRSVAASDGETTDEDSESENIENFVDQSKPAVAINGEPTPSEDVFSTPMDRNGPTRADQNKDQTKAVIVEISQNVQSQSKRRATGEIENESKGPPKKRRQSQTSTDDTPQRAFKPTKRGVGRPKKGAASVSSVTPTKPAGSSKQSPPGAAGSLEATSPRPRVAFSSSSKILRTSAHRKFLTSVKCKVIDNALDEDFDIFCVGNDGLKKTGQLLMSVALGRHLVTDHWVTESSKTGYLLAAEHFLPSDPEHEDEWGMRIADIAGDCRTELFADIIVYITPAAKKAYGAGFKEIEKVLRTAGAKEVVSGSHRDLDEETKYCVIVNEKSDYDASALQQAGHNLYSKDIISLSILRGHLDLTSAEFRIEVESAKKGGKKGR